MLAAEPASIGGVIDSGIRLFKATYKQTVPVTAIAAIPYVLASGYMSSVNASLASETDPAALFAASLSIISSTPPGASRAA